VPGLLVSFEAAEITLASGAPGPAVRPAGNLAHRREQLTGGEHRAIFRPFYQEEIAVLSTVATQLKGFNLAAISGRHRLEAAEWARLEGDRLPERGKTLAMLQAEYAEMPTALPVSEPTEFGALLRQAARAMRFRGDRLSVSQERFIMSHLQGGPHPQGMTLHPEDSNSPASYVRSICDQPGTVVRYPREAACST
jgi:hypothetical protein